MGAKHSKGTTREELQDVLPRCWSDLEHIYARYQQEVFRRKSSDAQCQFFLTFPVFRNVVLLQTTSTAATPNDDNAWRDKERLLRAFHTLDRQRRQRIAAIDFFAGLALATDAKKAAKFEFLFSLLDNGGLKVLNSCEVMMILSAAARGLGMFKAIPPVDTNSLQPLARRLMGDVAEISRASLVEKALTDPEIVFFMNDLENETATTSDALLAQQARLMKSIAANELQLHRVEVTQRAPPTTSVVLPKPVSSSKGPRQTVTPSSEAMLRKLQAILLPPPPPPQQPQLPTLHGRHEAPRVIQNAAKRVDSRSLCKLVHVISDGSLQLRSKEAEDVLSTLSVDDLGYVRSSDVLRVMRAWLARASMVSPPVWQSCAFTASQWLQQLQRVWLQWTTTLHRKPIAPTVASRAEMNDSRRHELVNELNYSFRAHVAQDSLTNPKTPASLQPLSDVETGKPIAEDSSLRMRLRVHHTEPDTSTDEETDASEIDDDEKEEEMVLLVELGLRSDLSDDEAIDIASAVEQFLGDEAVLSHIDFALAACQATVVDSQLGFNEINNQAARRCLRLRFPFKTNIFEDFEHVTRCKLSRLVRSGFVSVDFDKSIHDLVDAAQRIVALFPHFTKQEEREKLLIQVFAEFDVDKDGKWSLQEFNAFQQKMGESALDASSFGQCFAGKRELVVADLIKSYQSCSTDDFRALVEKLGRGSLASQLRGVCSVNATMDEHELKRLEHSLSSLRWGDGSFKRLSFLFRSLADMSCDFHCRTVLELLRALGVPQYWWSWLDSATAFVDLMDTLRAFVSPKHAEHERDFVCRSLLCSMDDVVSKTPQQLELEDQQHSLPQGTSARRAATLLKAHKAAKLVRESVESLERVAIISPQLCISCEIDNFNLMSLLREPKSTVAT